jgi:hypothetical protein
MLFCEEQYNSFVYMMDVLGLIVITTLQKVYLIKQ